VIASFRWKNVASEVSNPRPGREGWRRGDQSRAGSSLLGNSDMARQSSSQIAQRRIPRRTPARSIV
jgi:hypothetical protein